MAISYIAGNTNYDFEKADIIANFTELTPLNLTAGSTITAATTVAGHVGRLCILQTSATATVKICTALRASASASDTWVAVSVS